MKRHWKFCARFSDVISWGNQWWRRETSFQRFFGGALRDIQKNGCEGDYTNCEVFSLLQRQFAAQNHSLRLQKVHFLLTCVPQKRLYFD